MRAPLQAPSGERGLTKIAVGRVAFTRPCPEVRFSGQSLSTRSCLRCSRSRPEEPDGFWDSEPQTVEPAHASTLHRLPHLIPRSLFGDAVSCRMHRLQAMIRSVHGSPGPHKAFPSNRAAWRWTTIDRGRSLA